MGRFRVLSEHAKLEGEEITGIKERLRQVSREILDSVSGGEEAKRVLIRAGKEGGGVEVSPPDYEKDGNRPSLSEATMKEITRAGGFGLLVDDVEGGEAEKKARLLELVSREKVVILKGKWVTDWFLPYLEQIQGQVPADWGLPEIQEITKVVASGITRLKELSRSESPATRSVAEILLDKGLKDMAVSYKK
ncbi:MAG: hypothetical protein FJ098_06780 [Deltaproteobacteria bacterium]|nr:hypothetical protein [Deltaproteobacteria bacterium]